MSDIVKESYYIILPILMSSFFGYVVYLLKETRKDNKERELREEQRKEEDNLKHEAISQGLICILRFIIRTLHTEYTLNGSITEKQLSEFNDYCKAYEILGGNGVGKKMNIEVNQLPIDNTKSDMSVYAKMCYFLKDNTQDVIDNYTDNN